MKIFSRFIFLIFFSVGSLANAFEVPTLKGPVMDQVGYLDKSENRKLSEWLIQYNRTGKAQIQVLVLSDLQDEVIESASIKITDQWKLGDATKDNGILFLIAAKERKLRIEVGQGLEGALPDLIASRIISNTVKPLFKAGRMADGIFAGVQAIVQVVDKEYPDNSLAPEQVEDSDSGSKKQSFPIILVLFVILIVLSKLFRGGGYYGGGGGFGGGSFGGGGGGGWSGGGGGFSGGGSSGSW